MRKYFAIAAFSCIATGLNSRQVIDMLKASVEQHRAGAEPNDDLTLMCLNLSSNLVI